MGNNRNIAFWVVLFLLLIAVFQVIGGNSSSKASDEIPYSQAIEMIEKGDVKSAEIDGENLTITLGANNSKFRSIIPNWPFNEGITESLLDNNVEIEAVKQQESGLASFLQYLLPFVLIVGVWIFFMNRMQGGGRGGAMGFGKSKAKLLNQNEDRKTFDDVAGIDEAKEELEEIVEFLRDPQKFSRLGGQIPKGALLIGPPGTGKTLLARAIAGEAGVPFFTISGSDFVEMFVGVGASRVRDMFEQSQDRQVILPFNTMRSLIGNQVTADLFIQLTVSDLENIDNVSNNITALLRNAHGLEDDEEDDFRIQSSAQLADAVSSILGSVTLVMGGIVSISLLVGGIGIMNIMLVSVTERTREIGICKAIGAKRHQILLQFLFESIFLCLLGGLIGLILGYGFGLIASNALDSPAAVVPLWAVLLAFGFSAFVGIVFGIMPAAKAANLDPIEALRYE